MKVVIATGAPFWAGRLAAGLARDGHACTLLLGRSGPGTDGIPRRSLPWIDAAERGLSAMLPAYRGAVQHAVRLIYDRWAAMQVSRLSPDLVIGWSSWTRQTLVLAARRGAATALERGSTHIESQQQLLREEFLRWGFREEPVDRRICSREIAEYDLSNWITVPSTFARASFLERGVPADRLEVVPFGVDTNQFRPTRRSDSRFRVLFVGLIDLRKGVPYLLQAYERVHRHDTELLLVGPLSKDMRTLTRSLGIPYRRLSVQAPDAIAVLMAQSSVLVVPSIEEGLARVILEGMACGIPVIATTNTGAVDVISDESDGFIVAPRDVDAMADCLCFLRDHPDLARAVGVMARRKVEQAFTWDDYNRRVAEVARRRMGLTPAAAMALSGGAACAH